MSHFQTVLAAAWHAVNFILQKISSWFWCVIFKWALRLWCLANSPLKGIHWFWLLLSKYILSEGQLKQKSLIYKEVFLLNYFTHKFQNTNEFFIWIWFYQSFLILNSIPATGITRILYVILTQLTRTVTWIPFLMLCLKL